MPTLTRRRLFQVSAAAAGSGFLLGFGLWRPAGAKTADGFAPNAYIHVGSDNRVTLYSKNPEIGQGIKTAFGMILAEELDADWSLVTVEQAATDATRYGRQFAGGSMSVRMNWDILRPGRRDRPSHAGWRGCPALGRSPE